MSKVFSEVDSSLRRCRKDEIGMPWEDRWSIEDFVDGFCNEERVGQSKAEPEPEPPEPEPPEPEAPMSDDIFENEMAAYKADPARYRSSNASNLNKLLEMAARRQEKALEAPQRLALDRLVEEDLKRVSLTDLKRILIEVVLQHVPEDRQEAALRCLRR